MKIGFFADGPWAKNFLIDSMKNKKHEIRFVSLRFDIPDQEVKLLAEKNGIPVLIEKNINQDHIINKFDEFGCDIFVSISFNQIFKAKILNTTKHGIINCHAGKLPFYRGRNILNWALINDEKEMGITVHYVDEGIDTGDIILQRTYPITDDDNYKTLLEKSYTGCSELVLEALDLIETKRVKRLKQTDIHPTGFYCGMRKPGDEIINWNQTSRELFNFIRSICPPGPGARTLFEGEVVTINKAQLISGAPVYKGIPGQVLTVEKDGFIVKTQDSFIKILDVRSIKKITASKRLGL